LLLIPLSVSSDKSLIVIIAIGCELRRDRDISRAKLSKNNFGAGAPVSESRMPLFENSIASITKLLLVVFDVINFFKLTPIQEI
jgi:hypothetical protein